MGVGAGRLESLVGGGWTWGTSCCKLLRDFMAQFGCLVEILALRDCLDSAKTTLNVVLWPGCGRLCELYVICPKKCLETVLIEKN